MQKETNYFFKIEEPRSKRLKTNDDMLLCSNPISDEQFNELKKELMQRKNELNNVPKFRLKFFGEKASLSVTSSKRQPLMFEDIQYVLMLALLGNNSPFKPDRWCILEKANRITHSVILVIEGLTSYNFLSNESLFVKTKGIFENQLEVVLPKFRKNKIIEELSAVPLTQAHKEILIKKYGSLEAAMKLNKNPNTMFANSLFPIDIDADEDEILNDDETFPRTRLLLSPLQMMVEGYPMPIKGEFEERFKGFRFTKDHYKSVSCKSPMFGLDCEMCRTVKAENELARVSIVDENYQSVYETLVRPENEITNYLTPWSGITKEMMQNVTKTLKQVCFYFLKYFFICFYYFRFKMKCVSYFHQTQF
jgi:RNA exonuclease 1